MVRIIPYNNEYLASYQNFARRNWGANCYQQSERYLNWLYQDNPYKNPDCPFLLVVENDSVVGAIHKMRLPWLIDGQKIIVSAIHNLLVDPQYRRGSGLMLITASFKGETNILCPGVLPPLSDAYKMLRCQEINAQWFRKIIWPLGPKKIQSAKTEAPSAEQISAMVKTLNNKSGNHILWEEEIFKWRFLQGPKHIFLWEDSENFLILSVGKRKGLTVARVIDGNISNEKSALFRDAVCAARQYRASVLLIYTANTNLQKHILIKPRKKHPLVFFYHKDKQIREMNFNASAGDFGFEGFNYKH